MATDKPVRVAFISAVAGTRVRILLPHGRDWHTIIWFKLTADGTFIFGPSYNPARQSSWQKRGRLGTSFELRAADFAEVTDPGLIKHSRTSIHPSGLITLAGERIWREPLRHLFEQERLCSILFERPERYPIARKPDKSTLDLHLRYPVDYGRPLVGEFDIAPAGKERYVLARRAPYQVNPIVQFTGFTDLQDRSIQFVLCHLNESQWPDATYLIIPAGRPALRERIRRLLARLTTRWSRPGQLRQNGSKIGSKSWPGGSSRGR